LNSNSNFRMRWGTVHWWVSEIKSNYLQTHCTLLLKTIAVPPNL
jgi:hypothetical protein